MQSRNLVCLHKGLGGCTLELSLFHLYTKKHQCAIRIVVTAVGIVILMVISHYRTSRIKISIAVGVATNTQKAMYRMIPSGVAM